MAAKSFMFLRNTVERTTLPSPLPAASKISDTLRSTRSVCAPTSPATTCCVDGSMAICPDVKTNPFALTACEYGPIAWGASLVETTSRMKPPSLINANTWGRSQTMLDLLQSLHFMHPGNLPQPGHDLFEVFEI